MKIETKSKQLEVTFLSGRKFDVNIVFDDKKVIWDTLGVNEFKTVLDIRTYANELSQIAQLVQDELNKVHGYEFNEEVEKKDEPIKTNEDVWNDIREMYHEQKAKELETETLKEIVDSVNEETEEDKLRKIYFELYDKMEEPERSQAKANWNYDWATQNVLPKNVDDALTFGFNWTKTKQHQLFHNYWKALATDKYANK